MTVTVKGSAITARIRWVREHRGEDGVRATKSALSPELRDLVERRILPHDWAPFELFVGLSETIDRLFGRGDLELCRELGRYSARVNLPTIYRIFYALGNPAFIVGRAPRVWDVHYSSGRLESETFKEGDGVEGARLRIVAFRTPHRAHCLAVLGWSELAVELSGGKLVAAEETRCRTRGDDACEIISRWRR